MSTVLANLVLNFFGLLSLIIFLLFMLLRILVESDDRIILLKILNFETKLTVIFTKVLPPIFFKFLFFKPTLPPLAGIIAKYFFF